MNKETLAKAINPTKTDAAELKRDLRLYNDRLEQLEDMAISLWMRTVAPFQRVDRELKTSTEHETLTVYTAYSDQNHAISSLTVKRAKNNKSFETSFSVYSTR